MQRGLDIFSKEEKEKMIQEIIDYYAAERNEQIGVIAADEILDFILQAIAPKIYNKAVEDVKVAIKKEQEELLVELDILKK